jgi:uncharacterized protein
VSNHYVALPGNRQRFFSCHKQLIVCFNLYLLGLFKMEPIEYLFIISIFFATSAIGVVTGSNSLIAVPALFLISKDIDPKVAIATNMFGLTFMSVGASIPFIKERQIDRERLLPLLVLTLVGSGVGALLIGLIESPRSIKAIIAISMIGVSAFVLLQPKLGNGFRDRLGTTVISVGYVLSFLLAIYGGFFSGGYVTMLTFVFVAFFAFEMRKAIATTKVVNVFSSLIATLVFIYHGFVDFRLGSLLAVTMFTGAYVGARIVTKIDDIWLKRIFFGFAILISLKLIFDLTSG